MPPDGADIARRAWNLMGGEINWAALPVVAELFGIEDIEPFLMQLVAIRDWQRDNSEQD